MYFSYGESFCENHHTLPIFRRQVSLSVIRPSVAAQCKHVGGAKLGFVFGALEQGASIHFQKLRAALNLETAIGREKAVQAIYVHRKFLKLVVTLRVMRDF